MPAFARLLRYFWVAPASLVGLVAAALACATGGRARVAGGVLEVAGGLRPLRALVARCGFCAITLGHVILAVDAGTLAASRTHELVHVRQYERWGVLFFALYLGESLLQALRGRHAYRDNRFEREAFARAAERPRA